MTSAYRPPLIIGSSRGSAQTSSSPEPIDCPRLTVAAKVGAGSLQVEKGQTTESHVVTQIAAQVLVLAVKPIRFTVQEETTLTGILSR